MNRVGQPLAEKIYAVLLIPAWMWTLGWLVYSFVAKVWTEGMTLSETYFRPGSLLLVFGPIAGLVGMHKIAAWIQRESAHPDPRPLEDRIYAALILPARIWTWGWIVFWVILLILSEGKMLSPTLFSMPLVLAPIPLLFAMRWIATRFRGSQAPAADHQPIGEVLYSEWMVCAIVWTASWAVFGAADAIFVTKDFPEPAIYLHPVVLLAILAPAPMLFLLKKASVMIRDLPH